MEISNGANPDLQKALSKLSQKESLNSEEMTAAMELVVSGKALDEEIERFLLVLREKGETAVEIVSAAKVMRKHAVKLSKVYPDLLDTCGTGGDGQHTLNISTLAALVACAAGAKVAKHGNRSVSSVSGSADILESLGIKIDLPVETIEKSLNATDFAFFFAPQFHPATRFAMPARKKIQGKTIFNILGPLSNPANVSYQVIGVYDKRLLETMAKALLDLCVKRALVVHGLDGVDEISISSETMVMEFDSGKLKNYQISPEACGIKKSSLEALRCRSKEEAKALALDVLKGIEGPAFDAVSLNAAAALYVSGRTHSIKDGVESAKLYLKKGAVYNKLQEIISFTQKASS